MLNWKHIGNVLFTAFVIDVVIHAILNRFKAKTTNSSTQVTSPQHGASENVVEASGSDRNLWTGTTKLLFFPETGNLCRFFFKSSTGCRHMNCNFSHEAPLLNYLVECLNSTKETFDLCIYLITSGELTAIISQMHARQVRIRIITDGNYTDDVKSKIGELRALGIPIRHNQPGPLMHHKFAILDDKTLMNGSFNWTWNAIVGNHENLAVTTDEGFLKPFRSEFQRLWDLFDPAACHSNMNGV